MQATPHTSAPIPNATGQGQVAGQPNLAHFEGHREQVPRVAAQRESVKPQCAAQHQAGADPTLCHDVVSIFQEATRDRRGDGIFSDSVNTQSLHDFADWFAARLAARIGGRYIPKRDDRAVRDAAVWKAFTGRNHKAVMTQFNISRRLLYSILARQRKT